MQESVTKPRPLGTPALPHPPIVPSKGPAGKPEVKQIKKNGERSVPNVASLTLCVEGGRHCWCNVVDDMHVRGMLVILAHLKKMAHIKEKRPSSYSVKFTSTAS